MRTAVLFDTFAASCPFFEWDTMINNGYGCRHPMQENKDKGEDTGMCLCVSCPLGTEAEQEDLTDKYHPDTVKDDIYWNDLCSDGEVYESEILLVKSDESASDDQKEALLLYEHETHRYDEKWCREHDTFEKILEEYEKERCI